MDSSIIHLHLEKKDLAANVIRMAVNQREGGQFQTAFNKSQYFDCMHGKLKEENEEVEYMYSKT